jgi:hypothetical protein
MSKSTCSAARPEWKHTLFAELVLRRPAVDPMMPSWHLPTFIVVTEDIDPVDNIGWENDALN